MNPVNSDTLRRLQAERHTMAGKTSESPSRAMEKSLDGKATLLYAQGSNIWRDRELQKNGEQGKSIAWGNEVKMKATDKKRSIQEMYVTVNKTTYAPSQVKMRQGTKWTTIKISSLKKANISNATFTFPAKDYPNAEIVDLR